MKSGSFAGRRIVGAITQLKMFLLDSIVMAKLAPDSTPLASCNWLSKPLMGSGWAPSLTLLVRTVLSRTLRTSAASLMEGERRRSVDVTAASSVYLKLDFKL